MQINCNNLASNASHFRQASIRHNEVLLYMHRISVKETKHYPSNQPVAQWVKVGKVTGWTPCTECAQLFLKVSVTETHGKGVVQ